MIGYPEALEQWWLRQAYEVYGRSTLPECQTHLEKDIQSLSDLFTTRRDRGFGLYGQDRALQVAYGLFYFPQTFTRIRFPLIEALRARSWKPEAGNPFRMLDLGCGLGAATTGAASLLLGETDVARIEATAVDRSPASLGMLEKMVHANRLMFPLESVHTIKADFRTWINQRVRSDAGYDLILLSFSLGEAFAGRNDDEVADWVHDVLDLLRPGGLLLIAEPALKETSERLEALRDALSHRGRATLFGPCLHHKTCPLLRRGRFWCHEVRKWNPPESLEFLNRRLNRRIRELKFSYVLAGHVRRSNSNRPPPSPTRFRLVSPMTKTKGKCIAEGCAEDGEHYRYEWPTRSFAKPDIKKLLQAERGDLLKVKSVKPLVEGRSWRVDSEIPLDSRFTPVS